MKMKHDFRSVKNATFDPILPPNAAPERVGLVAAGNPDVLSEAKGSDNSARKRKRGGRVKRLAMSGARARHRLDRRSRRKFDSGGAADDNQSEQPAQAPPPAAAPSWLPPRYEAIGQGASVINRGAEAIGRGVASGLMAIDKAGKYLWVCRGIRPLPLPDKPAPIDPSVDPDHLQRQPRQVNAPHLK